jgi:two-component system response regulator RegX3
VSALILLVEDDDAIARAVTYALRAEGFDVDCVGDGERALQRASERAYDALILDVMLPGISGNDVCRELRKTSDVPILLLTAKSTELDEVVGLESGADDFVSKPFSLRALISRIRAILRRRDQSTLGTGSVLRVGDLHVDLARHEVTVDGRPVLLTSTEFRLLALLAHEPGRVFRRREILQHLWSAEFVAGTHVCDVHVSRIRKKLEREPTRPERLLTERGVGFKLVAAAIAM